MRQVLLVTISVLLVCAEAAAMNAPWSVNGAAPVIDGPSVSQRAKAPTLSGSSAAALPFLALIRGFQHYVSPVDGDRCMLYPTCSTYGLQAFRKHGALKGIVLTADRLLHEYDEGAFAPRIIKHGHLRYYDPLEYNDFWWHK